MLIPVWDNAESSLVLADTVPVPNVRNLVYTAEQHFFNFLFSFQFKIMSTTQCTVKTVGRMLVSVFLVDTLSGFLSTVQCSCSFSTLSVFCLSTLAVFFLMVSAP